VNDIALSDIANIYLSWVENRTHVHNQCGQTLGNVWNK